LRSRTASSEEIARAEAYAGSRRGRRMLVLVLEDITRYSVPLRFDKGVTMAGRYITRAMLEDLRARQ